MTGESRISSTRTALSRDACRSPTSSADEPEGVGSCQYLCSSLVGQDSLGPRSRIVSLNPVTTSL